MWVLEGTFVDRVFGRRLKRGDGEMKADRVREETGWYGTCNESVVIEGEAQKLTCNVKSLLQASLR